ncbi:hypothetical protein A5797_001921, partial [Enterococcus faecalis]
MHFQLKTIEVRNLKVFDFFFIYLEQSFV